MITAPEAPDEMSDSPGGHGPLPRAQPPSLADLCRAIARCTDLAGVSRDAAVPHDPEAELSATKGGEEGVAAPHVGVRMVGENVMPIDFQIAQWPRLNTAAISLTFDDGGEKRDQDEINRICFHVLNSED